MSSQLMHVSPSSPISTLPHELLEAILYQFVFSSDTGPVVLTEVCRHWRDIVYGSGRLWSQIDLQRPEAAKTHLKYAQGCALDVQWLNRSYGPGHPQAEYREWFWTESHRISTLILVHTSKTLSTIFSSMDPALPQLAELTLIAQDPAANLQVPLDIQNYTPQLTVLSLSHLAMSHESLLRILRSCPELTSVELVSLDLPPRTFAIDPPQSENLAQLPRLRNLSMMFMAPDDTSYFLGQLALPGTASVDITVPSCNLNENPGIRSSVLSRYRTCFSCIDFSRCNMKFSEDENATRCTLSLNFAMGLAFIRGTITLDNGAFNLSQVHTLIASSPPRVEELGPLLRRLVSLRTLRMNQSALYSVLSTLTSLLAEADVNTSAPPRVVSLWLHDIDLTRQGRMQLLEEFLRLNALQSNMLKEVHLCGCMVPQDAALQIGAYTVALLTTENSSLRS